MSLALAITTQLNATPAVVALLGAGANLRVYPTIAPEQVALPYAVWQHVASTPAMTHGEATQVAFKLVQFAVYAASYDAAETLLDALVAALDGVPLAGEGNPTLQDRRTDYHDATQTHRHDADFLV